MTKLTYAQQLAHPLWQRRRLEMLNAAGWKCSVCTADDQQLHVHHRQYFKSRSAWEYSDEELQVLCKACHERLHVVDEQIKSILCRVPPGEVLALFAGFFGSACDQAHLDSIYRDNPTIYDAGGVASCIRRDRPALLDAIYDLIVEADFKDAGIPLVRAGVVTPP